MRPRHKYIYRGPVDVFDSSSYTETRLTDMWSGETMAATEAKARSNLAYQYKKETNRHVRAMITLPGHVTKVS